MYWLHTVNISNKGKAPNADNVYTRLGKNYDKVNNEIVFFFFFPEALHYSVLYAFNGSEAGPLIRWQMR